MFPDGFWDSPLWKEAARAGMRRISQMVSQGNISGASRLAQTPGVLKPSAAGSQIKHLGQGGEGIATMVAHPEHGVAVRKLYDPRGISGQEMINRKEDAGIATIGNRNFAQFLGSAQTPHGGQMHFNEYIRPGQAPTGQAGAQSIRHTQTQAQKALTGAGYAGGKDIRSANMIYDANAGQHRVVDFIPAQKGEFMRMPKKYENALVQGDAPSPLNPNYSPGGTSQGGMLGRLLGGKSQSGGIRATDPAPSPTVAGGKQKAPAQGAPKTAPLAASPSSSEKTTPMSSTPPVSTKPMKAPQTPQAPATTPLQPPKPAIPPTTPLKPPTPASSQATVRL